MSELENGIPVIDENAEQKSLPGEPIQTNRVDPTPPPEIAPPEGVKKDPFYLETAISPTKYDWKKEFAKLTKEVINRKHPFVSFDRDKSVGLFAYARDCEEEVARLKKVLENKEKLLAKFNEESTSNLNTKTIEGLSKTISDQVEKIAQLGQEKQDLEDALHESDERNTDLENEVATLKEKIAPTQDTSKMTPQQKAAKTRKEKQEKEEKENKGKGKNAKK